MNLGQLYRRAVNSGIDADPRGRKRIEKELAARKSTTSSRRRTASSSTSSR